MLKKGLKNLVILLLLFNLVDGIAMSTFSNRNSNFSTVKAESIPGGFINVVKTESKTWMPLSGAEFMITGTANNGKNVKIEGLRTSDFTGSVKSPILAEGTYVVTETKSPLGYKSTELSKQILVKTGEESTVTFEAPVNLEESRSGEIETSKAPGYVKIEKKDSLTGEALSGAEFLISGIADDGTEVNVTRLVTEEYTGEVVASNVPVGTYKVTETKAPEGYRIDTPSKEVAVISREETVLAFTDTLNNKNNFGMIEIHDVDNENHNPIGAAYFVIEGITNTGEQIIKEGLTDKDGNLKRYLPEGKYTVTQLFTPQGYNKNQEQWEVTIKKDSISEVRVENSLKERTLIITKVDQETQLPLQGAEFSVQGFSDATGKKVEYSNLTTNDSGFIQLSVPFGSYKITETKAPLGYELSENNIQEIGTDLEGGIFGTWLRFENKKIDDGSEKGKIEILKLDRNTEHALQGAEFDVKTNEGEIKGHLVTDFEGKAHTPALPLGDYQLVETKAPPGYLLDGEPFNITIDTNGQIINKKVYNTKAWPGYVNIIKKDSETGETLGGAEFSITGIADDGTEVNIEHLITDQESGQVMAIDIPVGTYTLTETKAPEGYGIDTESQKITVEHASFKDVIFTDTLINHDNFGMLEIHKVDKTNQKPLQGALFIIEGISNAGDKIIKEGLTDKEGNLKRYLPEGKYTITELVSPLGYQQNGQIQEITVTNGETSKLTVENERLTKLLIINKVDSETKLPLQGAEFSVQGFSDSTGEEIKYNNLVTDETGIIQLLLPVGNYTITETKAPVGYEISEHNTANAWLNSESGLAVWKWFENKKIDNGSETGIIEIIKQDKEDTNVKLAGAVFDVKTGTETVDTVTTDGSGKATTKALPLGKYTLEETTAPAGYVLDRTPIEVTINTNGEK
ncbi:MAG: MSCRAMM family protein, partial [Culicoidibacterales bacterium]